MKRRRSRVESIFGLLVLTALVPAMAASRAEPQRVNLQGTWKLNEDLTARMREEDRPQGPRGGFHGGMGRRPGEPGGGFPGGPPRGGMGGEGWHRGGPPPSLAALDELTIVQTAEQVTITDKEGHVRVLETDGSKIRDEKAPGGPVELRASWAKDGSLSVKVKPDEGPQRTESYVVSNDAKHLYVTTTLEGGTREFKIRRAYDPVAEGKPASRSRLRQPNAAATERWLAVRSIGG